VAGALRVSGSPRGTVGGGVGGNGVDGKFAGSAPKSTWRHTGLPDDDDHPVGNVWDAAALMFFSQDYSFLPGINVSDGWEFSAPVGRFRPNNFGLSDLPGNVGAWCFDWSDATAYQLRSGTTSDPLVTNW
jgi:hypothetical protein